MITAKKEGRTRTFSEEVWKLLPSDKNGWEIIADVPKELKQKQSTIDPALTPELEILRAKYEEVFGKKPHHMIKAETLQTAIDDRLKEIEAQKQSTTDPALTVNQ